MIQIAICDDERLHLQYAEDLVARELAQYDVEIRSFLTADALLAAVGEGGLRPDIAVLDIQMEGTNGIALAHRLNAARPECRVIFLTGYLTYVSDVYETDHIYYVLKSEMDDRMGAALAKALAPAKAADYSIRYRDRAATKVVSVSEVRYLERRLKKTLIAAAEEIWTTQPPRELLAGLPDGLFLRCHQSYWVKLSAVKALAQNDFILEDGIHLPISRTYRRRAKECFLKTLVK